MQVQALIGKACASCDKREFYSLTDENNRVFPIRRYQGADGSCRFEVYNCANLVGTGVKGAGKLLDATLIQDTKKAVEAKDDEMKQKNLYGACTSGHYKRGVL